MSYEQSLISMLPVIYPYVKYDVSLEVIVSLVRRDHPVFSFFVLRCSLPGREDCKALFFF